MCWVDELDDQMVVLLVGEKDLWMAAKKAGLWVVWMAKTKAAT